jgi:hypothetical protein
MTNDVALTLAIQLLIATGRARPIPSGVDPDKVKYELGEN